MTSKKLFISLFIFIISSVLFSNNTFAIYEVSSEKIDQLLDNWYYISGSHRSEQLCKDNIKTFSDTASYYDRSECFRHDNKYFYFKCDKNTRCDLNYVLNQNLRNTKSTNTINNNSNINTTNNILNNTNNVNSNSNNNLIPVYLFRTYNNKTGKYYLKYSTNKNTSNIATHAGEYIDSTYVLSRNYISGTRAVYLWGNGADWYITYNTTSRLIWYAWENMDSSRIAIYNCYKWNDHYISNNTNCNNNKKYTNEIFYVYPDKKLNISNNSNNNSNINSNNNNNLNNNNYYTGYWVKSDIKVSWDNDITFIAYTQLDRNNVSFCINWKDCVKLNYKWEEFNIPWTNTRWGYKINSYWVPAWNYQWHFQFVTNWVVNKSNPFRHVIKKSTDSNITLTSRQKVRAFFTIPEWYSPKFFINYNWWEYNLIDEWWNITRSNWLVNYSQVLSLYIRWIYNSYLTYGNNRMDFWTINIK